LGHSFAEGKNERCLLTLANGETMEPPRGVAEKRAKRNVPVAREKPLYIRGVFLVKLSVENGQGDGSFGQVYGVTFLLEEELGFV
jgi:hypothetical protein